VDVRIVHFIFKVRERKLYGSTAMAGPTKEREARICHPYRSTVIEERRRNAETCLCIDDHSCSCFSFERNRGWGKQGAEQTTPGSPEGTTRKKEAARHRNRGGHKILPGVCPQSQG
jgi:hypothetical protein